MLGRTPGPEGAYHDIESHPDARPPDGIVILRIESGLYFANAENVRSRILDAGGADGVRGVVVDAETTPFIDISAARMLVAVHEELRARGVPLVLARAVGQVRDVLGCITDERDLTEPYPKITPPSRPSADGLSSAVSALWQRSVVVRRRLRSLPQSLRWARSARSGTRSQCRRATVSPPGLRRCASSASDPGTYKTIRDAPRNVRRGGCLVT